MTLADAGEVFGYWADNPPAHLMIQTIAAMLGWKPRGAGDHAASLADLAAAPIPGLALARDGDAAMPPAVLDPVALRAANRARAAEAARRAGAKREPME